MTEEALLNERQALLDRLFAGTITEQEKRRLEYVRSQLDLFEQVKYGGLTST
jgi:hypothetical protein